MHLIRQVGRYGESGEKCTIVQYGSKHISTPIGVDMRLISRREWSTTWNRVVWSRFLCKYMYSTCNVQYSTVDLLGLGIISCSVIAKLKYMIKLSWFNSVFFFCLLDYVLQKLTEEPLFKTGKEKGG